MVKNGNSYQISSGQSISSLVLQWAAYCSDKTFIIFEKENQEARYYSYSEAAAIFLKYASHLKALGLNHGDHFMFVGWNNPTQIFLNLAASQMGAVMVPADPRSTISELTYLMSHSKVKLVISEVFCKGLVDESIVGSGNKISCILSDPFPVTAGENTFEQMTSPNEILINKANNSSEDIATILYTSGTTSKPKGVMLSNEALVYGSTVIANAMELKHDDVHLTTLPLFHAAAILHGLYPVIVKGATVVVAKRFSPSRFFPLAIKYNCTKAALFASPLKMLLQLPENKSWKKNKLKNITFAIALSDIDYIEWEKRFNVPLQHVWGMTETSCLPIMSPIAGERRLAAMGRPVLGQSIRIVDENNEDVKEGEVGQLIVKVEPGKTAMTGYFENAEATNNTIRGEWLYTGDSAFRDAESFIFFYNRKKEIIKRGGENIAPIEIENEIIKIPGIQDAAVIGIPDPIFDEVPFAIVIRESGFDVSESEIRLVLEKKIAKYKWPVKYIFKESFPRTSVGKIQRFQLRDDIIKELSVCV